MTSRRNSIILLKHLVGSARNVEWEKVLPKLALRYHLICVLSQGHERGLTQVTHCGPQWWAVAWEKGGRNLIQTATSLVLVEIMSGWGLEAESVFFVQPVMKAIQPLTLMAQFYLK